MFVPYIERYPEANQLVQDLENNDKKFQAAQEEGQNKGFLPLSALIVMPVQRMPKYILLMREIQKGTPEWHSDYPLLQEAMDQLRDASQKADAKVNEAKRKNELYKIQRTIKNCPPLLKSSRHYVKNYNMVPDSKKEISLLSDLVIVFKNGKKKIFVQQIDLYEINAIGKANGKALLYKETNSTALDIVPEELDDFVDVVNQLLDELREVKQRKGE